MTFRFSDGARFGCSLALALLIAGAARADEPTVRLIGFGSCANEGKPQPIWKSIAEAKPDVFLLLGDNIYADTEDMGLMKSKYEKLADVAEFKALRERTRLLATWDDHDMGANDAGVEYPKKKESQQLLLDFLKVDRESPRRKQEGVYHSETVGPKGKRVQFIMLDTRYFRDPLKKRIHTSEPGDGTHGPYIPNDDPKTTMLGEAQWKWLKEQLQAPADLRIIGSSIQFASGEHGWEKWNNLPHERNRLIELIKQTEANGVIILSGDRHHAEISRMDGVLGYPLFDITSSSLNRPGGWQNDVNRHRIGAIYLPVNFGTIAIDWDQSDPVIRMQIRDLDGKVVLQQKTTLAKLR